MTSPNNTTQSNVRFIVFPRNKVVLCCICTAAVIWAGGVSIWAQADQTTSILSRTTKDPAGLQLFLNEQQALASEQLALMSQGATAQQIAAWRQQNAARLTAQQQRAVSLVANQIIQPMPQMSATSVPQGVSPTLQQFLAKRTSQINQGLPTQAQLSATAANRVSGQSFNTASQTSRIISANDLADLSMQLLLEGRQHVIPAPPPLQLPPNISAKLKAFLETRDKLMREEIAVRNQTANLDPTIQEQQIEQWRSQNKANFDQLRQLALQINSTE